MRLLRALALLIVMLVPVAAQAHDYAVGQVWEYRAAKGDEGSLIRIQEIEEIGPSEDPIEVFHISMINIHLLDGSLMPFIMHLPVSQETLDASVIRQSDSEAVFPDHREGLAMWREASGGVFTITVAEIGDVIRSQVAQVEAAQ